ELHGGGRDDALDAVLHHEVEATGAAAHDRLPDLHGKATRPRDQRDLFQRVAAVRHRRRNPVVLPRMREGGLIERFYDYHELFLEELAVGLGVEHGVAEAFHLAGVIAA